MSFEYGVWCPTFVHAVSFEHGVLCQTFVHDSCRRFRPVWRLHSNIDFLHVGFLQAVRSDEVFGFFHFMRWLHCKYGSRRRHTVRRPCMNTHRCLLRSKGCLICRLRLRCAHLEWCFKSRVRHAVQRPQVWSHDGMRTQRKGRWRCFCILWAERKRSSLNLVGWM